MKVITIARKPVVGTVAENVIDHGCGAINIGGCRVGSETIKVGHNAGDSFSQSYKSKGTQPERSHYTSHVGRWPANLILQGEAVVEDLGEQSGWQTDGVAVNRNRVPDRVGHNFGMFRGLFHDGRDQTHGGQGTAARYFKQVKP